MSILAALLVIYFLPTIVRGFALGLLVVAAFAVLAHAQTSTTTETNPMRLAVSGCMFNALQLNSMTVMVDVDTKKPFLAWECIGSSAQNLFEKLEMVANQEVNSDGSKITRGGGEGFGCVRYMGQLSHLGYRCYLSIPVSEPFSKLLNK
jgi:hypothetical protein